MEKNYIPTSIDVCAHIGKMLSAKNFMVDLAITYTAANGTGPHSFNLTLTDSDPEFLEMLNAWGARKCAEKLISAARG